jgi:hypothetical protein
MAQLCSSPSCFVLGNFWGRNSVFRPPTISGVVVFKANDWLMKTAACYARIQHITNKEHRNVATSHKKTHNLYYNFSRLIYYGRMIAVYSGKQTKLIFIHIYVKCWVISKKKLPQFPCADPSLTVLLSGCNMCHIRYHDTNCRCLPQSLEEIVRKTTIHRYYIWFWASGAI